MKQLSKKFKAKDRNFKVYLTSGLLVSVTLISNWALAAAVSNVSPETFAQYGKENAFWEITVSCEGDTSERVIQRKTDGDDWCPKGVGNLCSTDKTAAAEAACSDEYSNVFEQDVRAKEEENQARVEREKAEQERLRRQAAVSKPAPRPVITAEQAKLRNKISIQEQRIKLDQAKLELRRKELDLERRAIEIEDILKTLE